MRKCMCCAALCLVAFIAVAAAQDEEWRLAVDRGVVARSGADDAVPGIRPLEFPAQSTIVLQAAPAEAEAHWIWSTLGSDAARNILFGLVSVLAGWIIRWWKLEGTRREQAILCVEAGVKEVGDDWVRKIKTAREDGKLTEDERRQANREAIDAAIEIAKQQGIDLIKTFGKETLPSLVDWAVRKLKGESALTKLPFPAPLPDLGSSAPSV